MKRELLIISMLFLVCKPVNAQSDYIEQWQNSVGGTGIDRVKSIIQTADGGFIFAGSTNSGGGGAFTQNHGGYDFLVVRMDANRNVIWTKCYGGSDDDEAFVILETVDNFFLVAGYSKSDDGDVTTPIPTISLTNSWLIKIDYSGNIIWDKSFGGNRDDRFHDLIKTNDGGYMVAGITRSTSGNVPFNIGDNDYWAIKLDSACNIQWQAVYGGTEDDYCQSVIQTSDGGYALTGYTESSDYHVSANFGVNDYWIIKINSSGVLQWEKSMGGTFNDYSYDIIETYDGGLVITGDSRSNVAGSLVPNHGSVDIWLVKLNSLGNVLWHKYFGGASGEESYFIYEKPNHGLVITGSSRSSDGDVTANSGNNNQPDCWLVQTNEFGTIQAQNNFGGSAIDIIYTAVPVAGNSIVLGSLSNSFNFDVQANYGATDCWIYKITESYNVISGNVFVDFNFNNVLDANDIALSYNPIVENTTGRRVYANVNGYYSLTVGDPGSFTVEVDANYPFYSFNPTVHTISFSNILQTDSLNDFALNSTSNTHDLKITLEPITRFRAGRPSTYNIHYTNVGTNVANPTVVFYPDPSTVFSSSSITPSLISSDSIVWNLPQLTQFASGDFTVTVIPDQNVQNGDVINSTVKIEPINIDQTPVNNIFSWEILITGSFDPNDIIVNFQKLTTSQVVLSKPLDYIIRFQNTGNDTAFNVLVKNIFPDGLQESTFELINTSHTVILDYVDFDNTMWFRFNNIFLPDSNVNEPESHGFIHYRIIPETNLNAGYLIENQVSIFFDFNAPVVTNIATTEIVLPTGTEEMTDTPFDLYPNPFSDELLVRFHPGEINGGAQIECYTVAGKLVSSQFFTSLDQSASEINMPFLNISAGVYFFKVKLNDRVYVKKLIKM